MMLKSQNPPLIFEDSIFNHIVDFKKTGPADGHFIFDGGSRNHLIPKTTGPCRGKEV